MGDERLHLFGDYVLDTARRRLLRDGGHVPLPPLPYKVLKHLAENPGRVVSKREFFEKVWEGEARTDGSLVQCMRVVRRALGEGGDRYIRTESGEGYIFDPPGGVWSEQVDVVRVVVEEEEEGAGTPGGIERQSSSEFVAPGGVVSGGATAGVSATPAALPATGSKRPTRAALLVAAALAFAAAAAFTYFRHHGGRPKPITSVAVLPFVNEGGNQDMEYLSDGLSESLINSLSRLPQLKVIARSSAFRYRGKEVDPGEVASALGVQALLVGRVAQRGDSLVVSAELVDARDRTQLWGERYERRASDLISVQREIAEQLTNNLRPRLSGAERNRVARSYTENPEAYRLYLKGRFFWNKRTAESLRKAMSEFEQAVDREPAYALAYVGLADCYLGLETYAGVPAGESLPKARALVDQALRLDDSLAEAHTSSAHIFSEQWRWAEAEAGYRRALSINPNYPTARHWFAVYFFMRGQYDDALREIERAQELDPLSPVIGSATGFAHLLKNNYDTAVEHFRKVVELEPGFPMAHGLLGHAYLKQGRGGEALAEFEQAVELSGRASLYLSYLGYCHAVMGRRAEALRLLKELEEKHARREAVGLYLAGVHAGLGDKDQAFAWLERDYRERSGSLPAFTWWFGLEELRRDPRYADLVRRLGLEP